MGRYKPEDVRNIVLCGHSQSGKTTLSEALLFKTGALNRMGTVAEATTCSDFEQEERERKQSLSSSIMRCEFEQKQFHVIDTPGAPDFIGALIRGLDAADLALICVNAARGIELMTHKAWDLAEKEGVARMFLITRIDGENVNYSELLQNLQQSFGKQCVAFTVADGEGKNLRGVKRVLDESNTDPEIVAMRQAITESAVECDDALMARYLDGGSISHEEVMDVLREAICQGHVVPVFFISAQKDIGVTDLLHGIGEWGPDPFHTHRAIIKDDGNEGMYQPAHEAAAKAQVFKIVSDPHVGKLSFLRLFSGTIKTGDSMLINATGAPHKFAKLLQPHGGKYEEVFEAVAGDIVAVSKIEELKIGDTVCRAPFGALFHNLPFPEPMCGLAITPQKPGDEQKISTNMHRLCDEDPTFLFTRDELTGEQVIRGVGHLHLEIMLARLKNRFNLEVNTRPPRIPYLETITIAAEGSYRHKKQSGGAGQFAEVHLRLKPAARGTGFQFVNAIVGGVISGPFIPAVEKGVRKGMERGLLAGYPVVDMICELFDGKEHPVDSKDIAFQLAGEQAFREIAQKCQPVLLEPIVEMELAFPGEYTGAVSGDIATRRGRPTGMDQLGALEILKIQVPLAEVADYAGTLKSLTQGTGDFTMHLSHYDRVPANLAKAIIERANAANKE